jgi:hypothetical protein
VRKLRRESKAKNCICSLKRKYRQPIGTFKQARARSALPDDIGRVGVEGHDDRDEAAYAGLVAGLPDQGLMPEVHAVKGSYDAYAAAVRGNIHIMPAQQYAVNQLLAHPTFRKRRQRKSP